MQPVMALPACFRCFRTASQSQEGCWTAYPEVREVRVRILSSLLVVLWNLAAMEVCLLFGRVTREQLQGSDQQLLWDLLRC